MRQIIKIRWGYPIFAVTSVITVTLFILKGLSRLPWVTEIQKTVTQIGEGYRSYRNEIKAVTVLSLLFITTLPRLPGLPTK